MPYLGQRSISPQSGQPHIMVSMSRVDPIGLHSSSESSSPSGASSPSSYSLIRSTRLTGSCDRR
eukprot:6299916-Prymnesium_polylepis.1